MWENDWNIPRLGASKWRPNGFAGKCIGCKQPVAEGAGLTRRTRVGQKYRWVVVHLEGECDLRGWLYALTGMGPRYDLIKVGMSGIDPEERAREVIGYFGRGELRLRLFRTMDPGVFRTLYVAPEDVEPIEPRLWVAETENRREAEAKLHTTLKPYRVRSIETESGAAERRGEAMIAPLEELAEGREMYRTEISTVTRALADAAGSPAVEIVPFLYDAHRTIPTPRPIQRTSEPSR